MVDPLTDTHKSSVLPDPLIEEPPNDRWCDIVMKGGVASGVVYPWAILEIARRYRLRTWRYFGRCDGGSDSSCLRIWP